jgi:hypothetical protein
MSDVDDIGYEGEDPSDLDVERSGETDALLSRLRVIEDQPLPSRAAAFAQVYDELQARLENGETSRGHA